MVSLRSAPTGRARLRRYDAPLGTGHGLRHVRDTLARWGLDGDCEQASDAVLVAGELLANARQHGDGARAVDLSWQGARLRIAVSDRNQGMPRPVRPHLPARPSGHGLYLVECLAGRWGVLLQREGKTVWAELRMPTHFGLVLPPRPHADGSAR